MPEHMSDGIIPPPFSDCIVMISIMAHVPRIEPLLIDVCWYEYNLNLNANTPPSKMIAASSEPCNFGRGAYDTTGLPKPPPPQPQ
ncbi:uncharacterized protein TRIVIDRAFT_227797 [Trichoderma virens Gv29-8]|uniref:Uncharacterized protein n=1 Tax=Hypocrea virens (strain Gv29-8 / FGSC 10586) TaxID=413071 RepID=G9NAJ4_HYPVG|nr:uncharacterized protein TRIVIDRAFT_227797 [Trichoderma virens Gv29-8]EHK15855.1 hypothetical protein TRIVIDRAFT_227797 [Trichoderma virens Gv29-8]UKZ56374.1 hypothetical protein TrVGV298_010210 [Trichoderma virens]